MLGLQLMAKFGFLGILLVSVALFGSCSNNVVQRSSSLPEKDIPVAEMTDGERPKMPYGAYLAGRVAHLRHDFNTASDYYIQSLQIDPDNKELISRLYLLLASKGRIDEAAEYALKAKENGDKNNFIYVILTVQRMKNGNFAEALKAAEKLKSPVYKEFINPLLSAWAYAGLNQPEQALKELEILQKEPSFVAIYHFHAGMINDYFGRNREAQQNYEAIVNNEQMEMSLRALQVITNFYVRTEQKDKALQLIGKYNQEKILADILHNLTEDIRETPNGKADKIITDPNIGVAEALFSIGATLRQSEGGLDTAHMFISMAIYENPDYDLAKLLMADILENREMYEDANEVYDSVAKDSPAYYTAQLKKANNLVLSGDYNAAELLLKSLALDSDSYQLYLDLGDVLRIKNRPEESIKYYRQAIKKIGKADSRHWILYYALGISYEQNKQWDEAEKAFKKALELSQNHYLVLNYLGYSWFKQGRNIDQAFAMLVEAYNQAPNDGNINDSLGWALYNLGYYRMSIDYLEKAAELDPSNAVISDHLGDAYWFGGRKNEARFQWQHALKMKDDTGELVKADVLDKIKEGIAQEPALTYDKDIIEEQIRLIAKD